jgi:hypothetical protein
MANLRLVAATNSYHRLPHLSDVVGFLPMVGLALLS